MKTSLKKDLKNYDFKIEVGECSNYNNILLFFYNDGICLYGSYFSRSHYKRLIKELNVRPIEDNEINSTNSDFIQSTLRSYSLFKLNKLRSNLRIHMWKNQRTRENMITSIMRSFHENAFNNRQIISDFIKNN